MEVKTLDIDSVDVLTEAILVTLNCYPGLATGEKFVFQSLGDDGGLACYTLASPAVSERHESVTGHIREIGSYSFAIVNRVYGLNQKRKISTKEWLDNLGKWLEKQPITLNGTEYVLGNYPAVSGRVIKNILRTSSAYLDTINENQSENWVITLNLSYEKEYDKL